jgi:energy-coupling factor transporter transmembrane protein EcfT
VASVIAIVAGFKIDYRIAVFGTIIMIGLMLLLLIFSNAASPGNKRSLRLPSIVLTWSFLLLIIFSTTLLATSFFFSWPQELGFYFPHDADKYNILISGTVTNTDGKPINGAVIIIDAFDFNTMSNESGHFFKTLRGAKMKEIIKVRVSHSDYNSQSEVRQIQSLKEEFNFTLTKMSDPSDEL